MKNKNLIFSFLTVVTLTIGAGCLWTSCDDWTETEQVDYGVTTPDGQNPELYARYTQAVRNYKSRKHYAVCVRFDNGHSGDGEKDFLRSMPDSIDAVILENAVTLNSADLEDIPVLQTNFATKVLFSFNLSSIKENAESSGQEIKTLLAPALEQMVSAINDNGLDGACLSAINAENQQIIKQTPNFTPKNVKLGVFILFKTNHIRSENNLIKNRTNEKNNQFIFRKISYLCSK